VRDKYDNLAKLAAVGSPILILHGEADPLIPLAHAEALAQANPRARFVAFAGRGHNMAGDPAVQRAQIEFIDALGGEG
jgi:pimeloyl-ACP methyl ester carboxylesterase